MSRGLLDDPELRLISQEIPDLGNLQDMTNNLSPDFNSVYFPPKSYVPMAAVCLQDATQTLTEARYALHEVYAHRIWYLEKKQPPNKEAATFFARYYADDAALRLYAAYEQLTDGIVMMLEITNEDLKPYKQKGVSQRVVIGHFLKERKKDHPITGAIIRLLESKEWCVTMSYRNRWVHEQPPTVKGLGIIYKRERNKNETRWKLSPNGKDYTLGIGGGDMPEYSIEEIVGFIQPATFQFKDTLTAVVEFYIGLLKSHGISFN
jgi:hypothetical protein